MLTGLQKLQRGHDIFACNGILFNHESPQVKLVTKKLYQHYVKEEGKQKIIFRNLNAKEIGVMQEITV